MLCLARCYGNAQHCTAATRCVSVAYAVTRQSASVTILTKHNLYSKRRSINEKRFLIGQMSHLRLFAIPQSNTRPPARTSCYLFSFVKKRIMCAREQQFRPFRCRVAGGGRKLGEFTVNARDRDRPRPAVDRHWLALAQLRARCDGCI